MASSPRTERRRIVVDPLHGDIALNEAEWRVVDTASFQRLRYVKQLGMGHLVYPNATHTRFAHSLGVLRIMQRILANAKQNGIEIDAGQEADLRLAALLHDVGHYPYSHLMEGVDSVYLAEEFIHDAARAKQTIGPAAQYPKHVPLGRVVLTHQNDLLDAIGGPDRATRIADLFERSKAADQQWSKLISSSFDMDRLDYLLRDAQAAGVPYGSIDLNYLLNSLCVSPKGLIGVDEKALTAAEQYLFARYFMHRAVYWHKTTYAFEEAARQLMRRIRDSEADLYGFPANGAAVEELVRGPGLRAFTDSYIDSLIEQATQKSKHEAIRTIARSLLDRRPAKLLREVCQLDSSAKLRSNGTAFKLRCKHNLRSLADDAGLPLWRFMYCETLPLRLEKRGPDVRATDARSLPAEEEDELIKVFRKGESEPVSLVDLDHSLIGACSGATVGIYRLYLIDDGTWSESQYEALRGKVRAWDAQ